MPSPSKKRAKNEYHGKGFCPCYWTRKWSPFKRGKPLTNLKSVVQVCASQVENQKIGSFTNPEEVATTWIPQGPRRGSNIAPEFERSLVYFKQKTLKRDPFRDHVAKYLQELLVCATHYCTFCLIPWFFLAKSRQYSGNYMEYGARPSILGDFVYNDWSKACCWNGEIIQMNLCFHTSK